MSVLLVKIGRRLVCSRFNQELPEPVLRNHVFGLFDPSTGAKNLHPHQRLACQTKSCQKPAQSVMWFQRKAILQNPKTLQQLELSWK